MLPTLNSTNDYVHVSKKYNNGKNIVMGDCVVAMKPSDPHQRVCKRVSGMPGDIILIDPSIGSKLNYVSEKMASMKSKKDSFEEIGTLLQETLSEYEPLLRRNSDMSNDDIDDEELRDNKRRLESFDEFVQVPKGHVWLTGDNLSYSVDSRTYNFVPMGLIKGKIVAANDFNKPFLQSFRQIDNSYK
ncbi:hypothetical protein ACO0RG_001289 [Hanseniaspora osmophila]|uniref:Mitochondrial inner membrane protease subunit n=1 Tax=Hanseniaspora osmophila TaxID=56408 RepID=A0A1E5RNH7_9ASCO|nr:Mitochondrial inner membrane protease subunit 1 [Hanseniaspora osmophila]